MKNYTTSIAAEKTLGQMQLFPEPEKKRWEPTHWLQTERQGVTSDFRRGRSIAWDYQRWKEKVISYVRDENSTFSEASSLDLRYKHQMSQCGTIPLIDHLTKKGILFARARYYGQPEMLQFTSPHVTGGDYRGFNSVYNLGCGYCRDLLSLPLHAPSLPRALAADETFELMKEPSTAFEHFFET